jgi:DNA-binding CsgD family transcriptional regulator
MTLLDRDPADVLSDLTAKQVEVLDLLLQHKTTKQIARELNIAPNTVDARIAAVRDKWGATDRKATARVYAHLLQTCEKPPSGFSPLATDLMHDQVVLRDLPGSALFTISDAQTYGHWESGQGRPGVLEALDNRFGKVGRLGAALVLAFLLAVTALLSLSIAAGIERLV